MSNNQKYLLSVIIVFSALLLLFAFKSKKSSIHDFDEITNAHFQSLDHIAIDFKTLFKDSTLADDKLIISLMALSTEACTPCLNNVADLIDVIETDSSIHPLVFLFVNEPESRIVHFVKTSQLDIPYILIKQDQSLQAPEPIQHILFLDAETKELFYSEPVPNVTTPYTEKEYLLERVMLEWINKYKTMQELFE